MTYVGGKPVKINRAGNTCAVTMAAVHEDLAIGYRNVPGLFRSLLSASSVGASAKTAGDCYLDQYKLMLERARAAARIAASLASAAAASVASAAAAVAGLVVPVKPPPLPLTPFENATNLSTIHMVPFALVDKSQRDMLPVIMSGESTRKCAEFLATVPAEVDDELLVADSDDDSEAATAALPGRIHAAVAVAADAGPAVRGAGVHHAAAPDSASSAAGTTDSEPAVRRSERQRKRPLFADGESAPETGGACRVPRRETHAGV